MPGAVIHQEYLREGEERRTKVMDKMNKKGKLRAEQSSRKINVEARN